MSLDIIDLGLADTVRGIISDLNSGYLAIVREDLQENALKISDLIRFNEVNNLETHSTPSLIGYYPFISFKDKTIRGVDGQGLYEKGTHQVTLALPLKDIKLGDYAYINFSKETKVVLGVVSETKLGVSSLTKVSIMEGDLPYTWEYIKGIIAQGENIETSTFNPIVITLQLGNLTTEEIAPVIDTYTINAISVSLGIGVLSQENTYELAPVTIATLPATPETIVTVNIEPIEITSQPEESTQSNLIDLVPVDFSNTPSIINISELVIIDGINTNLELSIISLTNFQDLNGVNLALNLTVIDYLASSLEEINGIGLNIVTNPFLFSSNRLETLNGIGLAFTLEEIEILTDHNEVVNGIGLALNLATIEALEDSEEVVNGIGLALNLATIEALEDSEEVISDIGLTLTLGSVTGEEVVPQANNILLDGDFGILSTGTFLDVGNRADWRHIGEGWVSASNSRWVGDGANSKMVAYFQGVGGITQVIGSNNTHQGLHRFTLEAIYSNGEIDDNFNIQVIGIDGDFRLGTDDLDPPIERKATDPMTYTYLVNTPNLAGTTDFPLSTLTYDFDLGTGYQYLVVLIYTDQVNHPTTTLEIFEATLTEL